MKAAAIGIALTVAGLSCAAQTNLLPGVLGALHLGEGQSNVLTLLKQGGYSWRDGRSGIWYVDDRKEVTNQAQPCSPGINAFEIGFKSNILVDISLHFDHAAFPERDAEELYRSWVSARERESGIAFVQTEAGTHKQHSWVTTNAQYQVTKIWACRHSKQSMHSEVSTWMEALCPAEVEVRRQQLAAELYCAPTNGPAVSIKWAAGAAYYLNETNNPRISATRELMEREQMLRKLYREGPGN